MQATHSLKAGKTLDFVFDDLPRTLFARHRRRNVPTRMRVALPRNYNRHDAFPLLVYLAGGDGGAVTRSQLSYVRKLAGKRDYMAVAMPLFKKALDPREPHKGTPDLRRWLAKMNKAGRKAVADGPRGN